MILVPRAHRCFQLRLDVSFIVFVVNLVDGTLQLYALSLRDHLHYDLVKYVLDVAAEQCA